MPPVQDQDQAPFTRTYVAAAGDDNVIKATPGYLHSIIIGKEIGAGAITEVSDHATEGDGAIRVYLEAPTVGTYLIEAEFTTGITADLTNQTHTTFVWR